MKDSEAPASEEAARPGRREWRPFNWRRVILGAPRDPTDPHVFHKLSLVAFLAWVGLGADGLSSSAYGPDEAFRAILGHEYLAFYLALLMTFTVLIISYAYSKVIEHFPSGGGGYVVASKLLGARSGVVSGSALVVDYVLTVTVSVCSGVDAIMSFLPVSWQPAKVPLDLAILLLLLVMNLRGVKESITILLPIFVAFVVTHFLLITWGLLASPGTLSGVFDQSHVEMARDARQLGLLAVFLVFLRAYSLGGGTYTGIEAVSNGLQILRAPSVKTAKRTMALMAGSLAFTAGGILACYLVWHAAPEAGKTMNAVLLDRVFGSWQVGAWSLGRWLVVVTLISEGALLFVAAQTGFVDGPRVLANMAVDSWLPHRFANLSERLVSQNGVILMTIASGLLMVYTGGRVSFLVVLYSINVFLTFSLTQLGMIRLWLRERRARRGWRWPFLVHLVAFALCASILVVTSAEKLGEGGWLTFAITGSLVALCLAVQRHYAGVRTEITRLDDILTDIPSPKGKRETRAVARSEPVAVLLVSGYGGLGIHSLLSVLRLFPGYYQNVLFLSVGVVDSGHFKGRDEVDALRSSTEKGLRRYQEFARQLGLRAEYRFRLGTDVMEEGDALCAEVSHEFPRAVFFLGKLVFAHERLFHRFLHNDTAYAMQRRLHFQGIQTVIMPIRMTL